MFEIVIKGASRDAKFFGVLEQEVQKAIEKASLEDPDCRIKSNYMFQPNL